MKAAAEVVDERSTRIGLEHGLSFWAAILLCRRSALAMLEVFVPSGGLLGFYRSLSMLAAVFLAFRHGPWSGIGFLGLAVFAVPAGLILALYRRPKTPMGVHLAAAAQGGGRAAR